MAFTFIKLFQTAADRADIEAYALLPEIPNTTGVITSRNTRATFISERVKWE